MTIRTLQRWQVVQLLARAAAVVLFIFCTVEAADWPTLYAGELRYVVGACTAACLLPFAWMGAKAPRAGQAIISVVGVLLMLALSRFNAGFTWYLRLDLPVAAVVFGIELLLVWCVARGLFKLAGEARKSTQQP